MTKDVKLMVASCSVCVPYQPSQRLEPQIQTTASRPWEAVSVDLGYLNGTHYLVLMDRYSGWPLVQPLKKLDTRAVTTTLEDWFYDYGKPVSLRSDGGPQFRNDFTKWCEDQNIVHQLSSAYHHESNGHAEVAVREMKSLLAKTKDYKTFKHALREWRNTPRFDGLSPSQWLTGRRQRTEIVAAPEAYRWISDSEIQEHEARRGQRQEQVKAQVNQASRILEPMQPGEAVLVQDPKTRRWTIEATVVSKRNSRSYEVNIDGRIHVRNRRFLKPVATPVLLQTDRTMLPPEKAGISPKNSKGVSNQKSHNLKTSDGKKIHDLRPRRKVSFRS